MNEKVSEQWFEERGFHIENRIAYRKFDIEQIEVSLKVVGLK